MHAAKLAPPQGGAHLPFEPPIHPHLQNIVAAPMRSALLRRLGNLLPATPCVRLAPASLARARVSSGAVRPLTEPLRHLSYGSESHSHLTPAPRGVAAAAGAVRRQQRGGAQSWCRHACK